MSCIVPNHIDDLLDVKLFEAKMQQYGLTEADLGTLSPKHPFVTQYLQPMLQRIADSIADSKRRLSVYQGVYLNLDIFNPVATAWRDGRFETSLTIDVDLWHRLFPVAEVGVMTGNIKEELYNYETTGCFAKIGANYNFINFKADRKYDHIFYAGARYAYSYTEYSLKNAVIENKYWEETGTYESVNQKSNFGWFEVVVGVRAQIYKNFFMGMSMQVKTFGHFYEDTPTYPTYISGYGKYGDDVLFGLNYSLSYRF
jgi:hypothetical protein